MSEIIKLGRTDTMTSLEIAEITGKKHAHVMRDIRTLLEQGVSGVNFGWSSYKQRQPNGGCKDVPMFELTPKGCLILASGYDALLREKIINRLEVLGKKHKEQYQVPQSFAEALMLAAKQQMQIENNNKVLNIVEKTCPIDIVGSFPKKRKLKYETYIMKDVSNDIFKIGKSINSLQRLKTLRISNKNLMLYAVSELNVETKLHHEYSKKLIEREWYSLSDNELKDIISKYDFKLQ